MRVLFLGSDDSSLVAWLRSVGEEVVATAKPIDVAFLDEYSPDMLVVYGYRHIIKKDVLVQCAGKVINLHISYLPWNRGADPNVWSFVEDTPKGVTIHYVDEGIDRGDIIAQRRVVFSEADTLRTSYEQLQVEIQALFKEHWPDIRAGKCNRRQQDGKGTYHRLKDKERFSHLLISGWDTPIKLLEEYAAKTPMSTQSLDRCESKTSHKR
jgi:methionyl-tRNA formyltransferase